MATVLKITKTDKTTHVVPLTNKAFYLSFINRQPADKKWKLEEIDEKDAKDLKFIDETYVTPSEAVEKAQELEKVVGEKDAEIERLKNELDKKPRQYPFSAEMTISLINAATIFEQVEAISKDDDRKTVIDAAAKKLATFNEGK